MSPRDGEGETLGAFLRHAREEANLSLDKLAARLGTSRRTIIRWEQNVYQPSPDYQEKLARELNLDRDELAGYLQAEPTAGSLDRRLADLEVAVERLERHIFGSAEARER